jgi:NAD(P)-dependent dehydrogenase (short-subunit alcohol dehydrogenase family)
MSIFDRFRLDGKRLFITGDSRGLGREMALAVADAGADVVLVGRDLPSLEKTAGDIRALGRQAEILQGNVGAGIVDSATLEGHLFSIQRRFPRNAAALGGSRLSSGRNDGHRPWTGKYCAHSVQGQPVCCKTRDSTS